jgi:RNA polymerase sigma-70 factor (ECF subfamily)
MIAAIRLGRAAAQAQAAMPEFAALVRQHQALVFSIAWNLLHDRGAAEELAQEVFLQLHRSLGGLESPEHVTHWLRKVATHRAIDYARRQKARPQVSLEDAPEPATGPQDRDPLMVAKVRRLVASLPPKARAVVVLRYQEDLDPAEIANVLNMPVRTVKSHLARSLAMLREKMARTLPGFARQAERGGEVGTGHEPLG